MMKKYLFVFLLAIIVFSALPKAEAQGDVPSLWEVYEDYFDMGVSVEPWEMTQYEDLISKHFNVITIENQLKPNVVHPSEGVYDFRGVDAILAFAQEHDLKVRGHGLIYHVSMPDWFFLDANGAPASKALVMSRLESHVRTIVRRYKGQIYAYDVVNELFREDGAWRPNMREYNICGEEYIAKLFEWAHDEDPDAILLYNDNRYQNIAKRNAIYNLISGLEADGVPINGVGMQGHIYLDWDVSQIAETLDLFSALNSDIYITELDMRIYRDYDTKSVYPDFMIDDILDLQARKYASLFDLLRSHSDKIKAVGFWNVCDKTTWTDKYYVAGRRHHPLLFGYDAEPKSAFYSVVDLSGKLPRWEKTTVIPPIRSIDYDINPQNNMMTVRGNLGEANAGMFVTWKLVNPGVDLGAIDTLPPAAALNNFGQASIDENGDYEFVCEISDPPAFDGSAEPRFVLDVCGDAANIFLREEVLYYTKNMLRTGFKIEDELNDYSRVYSSDLNLSTANSAYYDNDQSGLVYYRYTSVGGEVVYKVPPIKDISDIFVDAYIYKDVSGRPVVSVSEDGVYYTPLSSAWIELPKTENTGDAEANKRCHYRFSAENLSNGSKFLKIELADFEEWWYVYLSRVEINTVGAFSDYGLFAIEDAGSPLLLKTENGVDRVLDELEAGELSMSVKVYNSSLEDGSLVLIAARYENGVLTEGNARTFEVLSGEVKTLRSSFTVSAPKKGTTFKLMAWSAFPPMQPKIQAKMYQ